MSLITVLLFVSYAVAQSLIPAAFDFSSVDSNSCLRRSVYVYTSESSTYVVTDFGSASLVATPTFCPNASVSISTVYGANQTITTAIPASTVTVYQQPTSTPQPAASTSATGVVVIDDGFENGNQTSFNSSVSTSEVTAQVVQTGPLQPYSGNNYL